MSVCAFERKKESDKRRKRETEQVSRKVKEEDNKGAKMDRAIEQNIEIAREYVSASARN
jgi:hypothetical protein